MKGNKKSKAGVPNIFGSKKSGSSGSSGDSGRVINTILALLAPLVAAGFILFVLMGGINQRAFVESSMDLGKNIGERVSGWFTEVDVDVNKDGIYLDIEGSDKNEKSKSTIVNESEKETIKEKESE